MPASDKVGAWLDDGANGAASDDDDASEAGGSGVKREENIEWESVLSKVRQALEDPSDKRRRAFVERYLYVDADCE